MALASTIETNSGAITPTGIVVALAPGADPNVPLELWRAADSAGVPDAANAVMVFSGVVPPSGISFFDQLPSTAATYWYRSRLNGAAYGPGPYNDWLNLGAADRVSIDALNALMAGDSAQRSVAWAQLNARSGSHSQQMLPNFGWEDGLAFWGINTPGGGSGTVVIDNTKAHSGNKYLSLSPASGQFADAFATDDAGAVRYFEVSPGDVVQYGGYAYRESGTSDVYYVIQALDKDLTVISTPVTPFQNTAAYLPVDAQYVVPAGIKYVAFFAEVNHTGTATVARFDDAYLRIAFGKSTVLNAQGSVPPTAIPTSFYTYASAGPTGHMWLSWGWISTNVTRADGSILNIPAPPAAPAAPTLSQVAGGALGARTRWARIAYTKSRRLYPVSAESSLAVLANNLLKVQAPTDPGGGLYDGWAVLVGSAANGEIIQSNAQVFGVDWTESVGGFITTFSPWSASWKSITSVELGDNVTVQEYGGYNLNLGQMRVFGGGAFDGPSTSASDAAAAKQNADGMVPLSFGPMSAAIPVGGGSNGGNGGGKF